MYLAVVIMGEQATFFDLLQESKRHDVTPLRVLRSAEYSESMLKSTARNLHDSEAVKLLVVYGSNVSELVSDPSRADASIAHLNDPLPA
jgi:hypothetical protein